jgi:isoamylase
MLGQSAPIGATVCPSGTNFSLYSREATKVDLLFFDQPDDSRPSRVVSLDQVSNRTYHYWLAFVPGMGAGVQGRSLDTCGCITLNCANGRGV